MTADEVRTLAERHIEHWKELDAAAIAADHVREVAHRFWSEAQRREPSSRQDRPAPSLRHIRVPVSLRFLEFLADRRWHVACFSCWCPLVYIQGQGVHHVPFGFRVLQPPPDGGLVRPAGRRRGTTSRPASRLGHDPDPACAPAHGATSVGAAASGARAARAGRQATARREERRGRQTRRAQTCPPDLQPGTRRGGCSASERARQPRDGAAGEPRRHRRTTCRPSR